jgi:hypothetical protein
MAILVALRRIVAAAAKMFRRLHVATH